MLHRHLLSAASLAALASTSAALAQQSLPTIDVGGVRHGTAAGRAGGGGARSTGDVRRSGSGVGSGGGGKPVLTSQNSYVVPDSSTGTKTDTPIMNTPLNVQVITQKVLEDQQATSMREALQNVSGVYVAQNLGASGQRTNGFFVRGFQTPDYYQDGVRVNGALSGIDLTGSQQFANISSIELLKGPAAILYGLSEPGGIVNIVTRSPQATPHYALQQQIGALAFYRTTFSATGPATTDKSVLYRVDMSYEDNGAPYLRFIDRTHSRNFFVAPVVKWQIDNDTWVRAEINYSNNPLTYYNAYAPMARGSFLNVPPSTNYTNYSPNAQQSVYAALTGTHNFNKDWSLRSRITFIGANASGIVSNVLNTATGTNPTYTLFTVNNRLQMSSWQTNQDLVGHFDIFGVKNTLLLGGDYYRFSGATAAQTFLPWGWSTVRLLYPILPGIPALPVTPTSHTEVFQRQDTAGLYVQDQVELPYGVHLMAGARYNYVFQWNTFATAQRSFVTGPVSNQGIPAHQARVTPRFGLLWRPQQWVSLYGNYTQSFAANSGTVYPGELPPPTNAESWEAGAKFEFFGGRVRASVDYYNLIKTNLSVSDPDPNHLCNGTRSCVALVGKARSSGPEVDIQGELMPGWNVIVNYTNQDVRIVEGTATGGSGTGLSGLLPGQRFPNVPRNLARLWTTYEFQDPTLKGLKVGGGYSYHGSQPIQDGTNGRLATIGPVPLISSWGTVDLMGAYSFDLIGYKTTAQINATNIFDRTYVTAARVSAIPSNNFNLNSNFRSYGAPFNIVGSLRVDF